MKPLIILLITFVIAITALRIIRGGYEYALSARIAMAVMLLFTAMGHFAYTKGMSMMIPDFIPHKTEVIYLTGIIEIIAGIGLLIPALTVTTGWLLIVFFVLILPANIYAAANHVDYLAATFTGDGLQYLWFRIPLQMLFIVWTYFSAIRY